MIALVIIAAIILAAAVATLLYYKKRAAKAAQAIGLLNADIAEMDAKEKSSKSVRKGKECKIVSLDDDELSLASAAAKRAPGPIDDAWK
ncbi:MAG: hypothetical protein ACI4B3_03510 [Prevotella sp.]